MNTPKLYLIVTITVLLIFGSTFGTIYYLHSNQAKQLVVQEPLKVLNDNVSKENEEDVFPVVKDTTVLANTTAQVSTHKTQADCWIIISNKIYSVSAFLDSHPGGVSSITPYCGKDATSAFKTHGSSGGRDHSSYAYSLLPTYFVSDLNTTKTNTTSVATPPAKVIPVKTSPAPAPILPPAPVPTPTPSSITYTSAVVATHNAQSNCWVIIQNKIYDVTSFMTSHPGGISAIARNCGTDITTLFTTSAGHRHSSYAYSLLPTYFVADLGSTGTNVSTQATPPTTVAVPTRTRYDDDD